MVKNGKPSKQYGLDHTSQTFEKKWGFINIYVVYTLSKPQHLPFSKPQKTNLFRKVLLYITYI